MGRARGTCAVEQVLLCLLCFVLASAMEYVPPINVNFGPIISAIRYDSATELDIRFHTDLSFTPPIYGTVRICLYHAYDVADIQVVTYDFSGPTENATVEANFSIKPNKSYYVKAEVLTSSNTQLIFHLAGSSFLVAKDGAARWVSPHEQYYNYEVSLAFVPDLILIESGAEWSESMSGLSISYRPVEKFCDDDEYKNEMQILGCRVGLYRNSEEEDELSRLISEWSDSFAEVGEHPNWGLDYQKNEKYLNGSMLLHAAKFEVILGQKTGFLLTKESFVDVQLFSLLHKHLSVFVDCLEAYPKLKQYYERMYNRPNLRAYLHSDPPEVDYNTRSLKSNNEPFFGGSESSAPVTFLWYSGVMVFLTGAFYVKLLSRRIKR